MRRSADAPLRYLFAEPDAGFGDAELEFAGVFADEEGHVLAERELEVGGKNLLEGVEGLDGLAGLLEAAEPVRARGVVLEPGVGGRDDQLAAGVQQRGQAFEALARVAEAVNQIGHEDDIETAEVGTEIEGVALLEGDAAAINLGGDDGVAGLREIALLDAAEEKGAVGFEMIGDLDEAVGIINADDFTATAGEFEGSAADGAAEIERTGAGGQTADIHAFRDAADGKIQGRGERKAGGEQRLSEAIMEQQILGDGAVGIVIVSRHAQPR